MDDPQQQRVYDMEDRELRGHCRHRLPLKLVRRYARRLCRVYDVPQVSIRVYAIRGRGGQCDEGKIQLDPKCGMNGQALAHELAHHICDVKHPRAQSHGPLFVWYLGCLMDSLRLMPFTAFKAMCRERGVKLAKANTQGAARLPVRPPKP